MNVQLPTVTRACTGSLLSPPNSPQISARLWRSDLDWRTQWLTSRSMSPVLAKKDDDVKSGKLCLGQKQLSNDDQGSVPELAESNFHKYQQHGNTEEEAAESIRETEFSTAEEEQLYPSSSQKRRKINTENVIFDGKLRDVAGHLYPSFIPDITVANIEDDLDYDEEYAMTASDPDENPTDGDILKTAAEERAEKRKMKRFRLTHSQTRFLQSEFARQAHPDAAQRERLSKEIPGLSSRQVQVWFQNRRAKMKRLTSDDRERIMRSRALPENFDTTRALHANHIKSSQYVGGYPIVHSPSFMGDKDSDFHSLRRQSEGNLTGSPTSMGSNMSDFYLASGPASATEMMSPVSITHETPHLSSCSAPEITNLHPMDPFSRSRSYPLIYQSQPHSSNLQVQEMVSRRRAGSLASPLGLNLPVTGGSWDHGSSLKPDPQILSSFTTSLSQPYMNLSHASDFPQNLQFSTVQNTFAPEMCPSLPPDRHWQGIQHSSMTQNKNNAASFSPDSGINSRHGLPTDYSNFYETCGQSLHMLQSFRTSQAGASFGSSTFIPPFPASYDISSPQHYQTMPEQERLTEDICNPTYDGDSYITAPDQTTINLEETSSSGSFKHQSGISSSRLNSLDRLMD